MQLLRPCSAQPFYQAQSTSLTHQLRKHPYLTVYLKIVSFYLINLYKTIVQQSLTVRVTMKENSSLLIKSRTLLQPLLESLDVENGNSPLDRGLVFPPSRFI